MNNIRIIPALFRIILILVIPVLEACSGGKSVFRPEARLIAETLLERAVRSQQKGEIRQAEQLFLEALASSSSIEDNPTRIIALVNLARLYRLNGNSFSAATYIDQALHISPGHPEFIAEVAYEKAHIELALNNNNVALQWANKALAAESDPLKGVRRNLLARIQHVAGDTKAAILSATTAHHENQLGELPAEEANSLRLLGTIELDNGRLDTAKAFILEALVIDKRIGASIKIGLDLEQLAFVAESQGNPGIEEDYLMRAYSVHLSAGRNKKATLILQKLVDFYHNSGNIKQEEKFRLALERLNSGEKPCLDPNLAGPL